MLIDGAILVVGCCAWIGAVLLCFKDVDEKNIMEMKVAADWD